MRSCYLLLGADQDVLYANPTVIASLGPVSPPTALDSLSLGVELSDAGLRLSDLMPSLAVGQSALVWVNCPQGRLSGCLAKVGKLLFSLTWTEQPDVEELQQQVQNLTQELHSVIATTPSMVFKACPEGDSGYKLSYVSHDLPQMLGYQPSQVVGQSGWWCDHIHPNDRTQVAKKCRRWYAQAQDAPLIHRYRFQHRAGHYLWVEERIQRLNRHADELMGSITVVEQEQELRERFHKLVDLVPGIIYQFQRTSDGQMTFPYASSGLIDVFGVTQEQVRESGFYLIDTVHPEDMDYLLQSIESSARDLTPWISEHRMLTRHGYRWFYGFSHPEKLSNGDVLWHGVLVDIDHKKRQELQYKAKSDRLNSAARIGQVGHWEANLVTGELFWSEVNYELLGLNKEQFTPTVEWFFELVHPKDRERLQAAAEQVKKTGVYDLEHRIRHADGDYIWVHELASVSADGSKLLGTATNITRQKQLELKLKHESMTDELTGLVNRRYFLGEVEQVLKALDSQDGSYYLAIIDVDHFKAVNDTHGHLMGDEVLKTLTNALLDSLRPGDLIGRLGGEEFALLLPNTTRQQVSELAEALLQAAQNSSVAYENGELQISITLGLTQIQAQESWSEAMQRADEALYQGKRQGRNQWVITS